MAQDLHARIMHLLPSVDAATLTHCTKSAWAYVENIKEKHLVPAEGASEQEGHEVVQHWPECNQDMGQGTRLTGASG